MISFFVPGAPVPFARAGAHGKRRFTPKRQSDAMAVARLFAQEALAKAALKPFEGPLSLTVRATFAVPPSWPKAKRARAFWKSSKPDLDNIVKLLKDSLNAVAWVDDAQVAETVSQKVYGEPVGLTVTIRQLDNRVAEGVCNAA